MLMSGTAMAQLITAGSMPVVTRLYTPEMIGVISIYLSFFNLWLSLLTWRYESALLIADTEEESHHVFRLGALLVLITALLAVPALGSLQYASVMGFEILPSWSPLVAFMSLLGFGWYMLYRCWLLRLRESKVISLSAVARSGANAGTRLIAGFSGLGIYGLFLAEILGSWAALGAVRRKCKSLLVGGNPSWEKEKLKQVAKKYVKFPRYEMPSTLINQLAAALPVPMVGALYGAQAAGWFGLARLLYAIPNSQIGKSVGDVFQMELGYCQRNEEYQKGVSLFYGFTVRLAAIGMIPFLMAVFLAEPLVPYVFGEEWEEMGGIVAHMAPWMFAALVVSSMSRALSVLQMQEWKLIYDFFALLLVLCTFLWVKSSDASLIEFIDIITIGMSVSYAIYYLVIRSAIKRMVPL